MQMFIAFNPDDGYQSKKILTYISHCLNAEIHEGNIDTQKGWIFIFRDELHPFVFGGKRRYTSDDEDAVAEEIQKGKSLRQIAREKHISPTAVHTLHNRYLARNPEAYPYLTRERIHESDPPKIDGSASLNSIQSDPPGIHSEKDEPRTETGSYLPSRIHPDL